MNLLTRRDPASDHAMLEQMAGCSPLVTLGFLRRSAHCVKLISCEGRLIYMNVNGQYSMGLDDPSAIHGMPWWELWPEEARPTLRNAVTRGKLGEIVRFSGDCSTLRGETRRWDVTLTPVRGADGAVRYLLVVSRDVTEQLVEDSAVSG